MLMMMSSAEVMALSTIVSPDHASPGVLHPRDQTEDEVLLSILIVIGFDTDGGMLG